MLVGILAALPTVMRPAAAQHLAFQPFDDESGLFNAGVGSLAQDKAGFLYFGTENGLYRYDGYRFSRLGAENGLPALDSVETVQPHPDGRMWVVFTDRVYLSGSGSAISAALDPRLDDAYAHRAAVLGNDLLLVRNNRLLRIHPGPDHTLSVEPYFQGAAATTAPAHDFAHYFDSVHVEGQTIWLGCGVAICRLDHEKLERFGAGSGLPADRWAAAMRDHAGTLWLRSAGRIASMPRGAARFTVIDVPGGAGRFINDSGQVDLVEDAAGRVVTQAANGVLVHENGSWNAFRRGEGMPYGNVAAMLVDREGSLWIGSTSRGATRLLGLGVFESWSRAQGLSDDMVWNMARDGNGTLWAANDIAVDAVAESARKRPSGNDAEIPPNSPDPLWHYPFRAFVLGVSPHGTLWIGRQGGGLIRHDARSGRNELIAQLDPIRVMASGPDGRLWVGTSQGLARIDQPDAAKPVVTAGIMPSIGRVFAIAFDRAGEPWVLCTRTLFHLDSRQHWQPVLQTDPEGGYQTRSMVFAPDGTLWLGSFTTGITRLHLDHGAVVGTDRQETVHLAAQDVEMMHRDPGGRIWIGTDHGLDVTDGSNWHHLDDQDGLAANDMNSDAAFSDLDGTSWFGTIGGLSHVIDLSRLFNVMSLHPAITGISMGDRDLPQAALQGEAIHLNWSADPLVIEFTSLDFRFTKSIRFRYRLLGADRNWVETSAHEVRYPEPPSGNLLFEVMAIDPLHRLQSEPVRIMIRLAAPWWRTWPVYVGLALLASALLAMLWRLRISYLLVRQRQLEALVAERTHEIEQARLILFQQANFDSLTRLLHGLPCLLQDCRPVEQAVASGQLLGLALMDLDHFKKVNDLFGHLGGDAVLAEVGRRLSASTREGDLAGRYGGEELLLVLPGLKRDAFDRIDALRHTVFAELFGFDEHFIPMTCSMGVTWLQAGDDLTAMIRRADAALYDAKRDGRNRTVFDPPRPEPSRIALTAV